MEKYYNLTVNSIYKRNFNKFLYKIRIKYSRIYNKYTILQIYDYVSSHI
jgi:hypothetical protein